MVLRGKPPFLDGVGGIASVQIYDLDLSADSTLANLSSRGYVQTGDNRMIAGLIVGGGNGMGNVLIRALGPSLADNGVTDVLRDPKLSLYNAEGTLLLANDDWADAQAIEIEATRIAPTSGLESAIITTIPNGSYTAIVEDFNGSSGVGLVEVYNLR